MADKTLSTLVINKLTKAQYDALPSHSADELWLITGSDYTVTSASYAVTASYAMNGGGAYLPITGGAITGSLYINGTLGQGGTGQGQAVTASGMYSHAQGAGSEATAIGAHAEGYETVAAGQYSHAEGQNTRAVSNYSHAGGYFTSASADYQTVVGKFNAIQSDALFIVGAGTDTDPSQSGTIVRKNAIAVDSAGNVFVNGVGTYSGTNPTAGTNDLATVIGDLSPRVGTLTNLTNVAAADYDVAYVSISDNSTLTFASYPSAGKSMHIIVYNNAGSTVTVTLPGNPVYVTSGEDTIDIDSGKYGEINIMYDNYYFLRAIGS